MHSLLRGLVGVVALNVGGGALYVLFQKIRSYGMHAAMHTTSGQHYLYLYAGFSLGMDALGFWALRTSSPSRMMPKVPKAEPKAAEE